MGIVRFALKFPYTFYVLAAFILFLGVSAIWVMPEDIFPEINIPVVSVIWQYTGLSVPEMEQRITTYSEYSISANVTGIKPSTASRCRRSISSPTSASTSLSRRSSQQQIWCAR
jgi:multidrug efflux pump subunit AcrB